ncbi:family 78 glycoside hydrolase catalytic domain [Amycolatopsis sp. WQ 127309]|uniref:family 78 glycoside hydrolase catalytic domain n=1 Tax=Amycolatopsis sp. WQ 127309 TaxID=2932773 RepID=UPI001FF61623|nr:family 78 glycoside hydrolase catalytic domain [Amycolatopsis sp. WQ 127309]UOZ03059.1 glycoside hydrolase family 78 protein [Amycolatopsis sp. WQ 127309]
MRHRPRRLLTVLSLASLTIAGIAVPAEADRGSRATDLRANHLDRPLGTDDTTPELTWRNTGEQTAYEVQAATSEAKLAHPDLWDTGRTEGATTRLDYAGRPLGSRRRVYWRVRTWSGTTPTPWSTPAWFETGLTTQKDWSAGWVTNKNWQLGTKPTQPVVVTLPKQEAQYVKLDVTKLGLPLAEQPLDAQNRMVTTGDTRRFPDVTYRLQLAELQVRDSANPTVNLADGRQKFVTASETQTVRKEWEPGLVADGLTTSNPEDAGNAGYQSATHPTPDADVSLTIDLGAAHTFDQVVLYPRTDTLTADGRTPNFPVDYTVQTATDSTFTVAKTVTDQPTPATWLPPALPVFAKDFAVHGRVTSARLYVSGLGVYVPSLNGARVGDAVLEPGDSDYADRVTYAAYDVTDEVHGGANTIGIAVGNGTADALHTSGRYRKFARTASDPQVIAQLEVTMADGTVQRSGTDSSWRTTLGATTASYWYGGEDYDARREIPGWDQPGTDRRTWDAVVPATSTAKPTGRRTEPVRVVEQLPGKEISRPAPGIRVYDLGRNIAGLPQVTLTAPAGTSTRIYPAEALRDGHVDQSISNVGAPIWDSFTSKGGKQTWHPDFTYHGFRYLEVVGVPETAQLSVTGLRTMADNTSAGDFDSSDATLDGIHRLTRAAVENNMQSILTDCPSREKLGWLEQDHLAFDAIARNYDVEAYLGKIVQDMADGQEASGLVPSTVPDHVTLAGAYRDDPNWGGALVQVPLKAYQTYGDKELLARYYPAMQRYLAYLQGQTTRWVDGVYDYGLGDWITTESPVMPRPIVSSFGVWAVADGLAKVATALGQDATAYRAQADTLAEAVWTKYYNPATGLFGGGGQGATALALDMGAVPADLRAGQTQHLVDVIEAAGWHLVMGEISFPSVLRVLSAAGRDDVVHRIATQTTSPSLGYQVQAGLTALGETWDGGSGQSQDHFMLGALDGWLTTRLTGIGQAAGSAGFKNLVIDPAVVGDLTSASGSYDSPQGRISTAWTKSGRDYRLTVTVPPGSTAEVHLPQGGAVFHVGPGTHTFRSSIPRG